MPSLASDRSLERHTFSLCHLPFWYLETVNINYKFSIAKLKLPSSFIPCGSNIQRNPLPPSRLGLGIILSPEWSVPISKAQKHNHLDLKFPVKARFETKDVMRKPRNTWTVFKTSEVLWEDNSIAASQFKLVRHASGTPLASFCWHREWKLWPWVVVSVASPLHASSPSLPPSHWQFPKASPV